MSSEHEAPQSPGAGTQSPIMGAPGYVPTPLGMLEKEFLPMTSEEYRTRLTGIRERRRVLSEELEQLQEEEARLMAQMRRSSSITNSHQSRRGSTQEAPLSPKQEEDMFKAGLSPEELGLLKHLESILELAMADQPSCRDAQKSLDAILTAEGVDVTAVPPQEGFEEAAPGPMSAADATSLASAGGAVTPQLRLKQRGLMLKLLNKNAVNLLTDQYGNYFVQRAFNRVTAAELQMFIETISLQLPEISCSMHGTRAVQRLIDCCTQDSHYEHFCEAIANEVVPMVCDLNANHVVHRLLMTSSFKEEEKENIFHIIMVNCVEIGMNKQGCCMIQRCLENAPTNFRAQMINALIQNTLQLVQDPFGNYVIQFVLDMPQDQVQQNSTTSLANRVIRQVLHHIGTLACNKFSSNVIEKCLRASTVEVRQLLLDEITDPATLPKLLVQSYANYVIQTALIISDENQFQQLKDAIAPLHHLLKNSPYGIKIEAKIAKRNRELTKKRNGGGQGGGQGGSQAGGNGERRSRRQHNREGGGQPQQQSQQGGNFKHPQQYPQMQQQMHSMPQQLHPPQQYQQQNNQQYQQQPQQHQQQYQQQYQQAQQTGYAQYQTEAVPPAQHYYAQAQAQPQQQAQFDTQQYYQQQQQQQQQHQQQQQQQPQGGNASFSHSPYHPVRK